MLIPITPSRAALQKLRSVVHRDERRKGGVKGRPAA